MLHKYNFDYEDFLAGAKFACLAVDETLFSKEYFDFVNGYVALSTCPKCVAYNMHAGQLLTIHFITCRALSESENADYLQSLTHPRLYKELKNVVRGHNISEEQLNVERSVPRLSLTRVATRVVQPEGAL